MFLLTEGMQGVHINTVLDEEMVNMVEEKFKKKQPIVEVQTSTSGSLPREAVESPHKQPSFQPSRRSWRDMRFD